jgi:predicted dehydrogenase
MSLRVGLLSTARINDAVIEGAAATSGIDIVAVSSRTPERAEAYAREKGLAHAYGSYEELLASDVEAVYIALPNALHVEWAQRALAAGKHVLVEKPLTRKPEEVDPLFDAADAAGLVVMEAYAWRHAPQGKRIAELVRDGETEVLEVETPDVYATQWDGFRAAIAGEATVLDRNETRQQATVLDALLRAAETGSAVEL